MADDDRNYEDLSSYVLTAEREREMLDHQTECTFMWTTKAGEPVGVIMNFVHRDGRFWLTSAEQRKRVAAVRRDPRVAITITSKGSGVATGRSVTYKGTAVIREDEATKAWFYPALAERVRPGEPDKQAAFARFLDSPHRVILEIEPTGRIGFDSVAMWAATPEAAPDGHLSGSAT
jgi:nitroimidazol reductase NimA-like FMN-containing flavoprotein (pyridoxamine 5'-phosphate oxidase superfamily)